MKKQDKIPDLDEFLRSARIFKRQLKIINRNKIPDDYKRVFENVIVEVKKELDNKSQE